MGICAAAFVSVLVMAGDPSGHTRALALLDAALERAWAEPDPRAHFYEIFQPAVVVDPGQDPPHLPTNRYPGLLHPPG